MVAGEVQVAGLDPGATIQASLGGADVVLLFAGGNAAALDHRPAADR